MPPLVAIGVLCVFGLASAFDYCALSSSNTLCLFQVPFHDVGSGWALHLEPWSIRGSPCFVVWNQSVRLFDFFLGGEILRHQPNITGPACGQVLSAGVTAADQKLIVDLHNQMRRRVAQGLERRGSPGPQPPAADMRQLRWDDQLALMAQTHANQCVFRHDIHRDVGESRRRIRTHFASTSRTLLCLETERFAVGQNVAIQMSTAAFQNADWSSQIQNWYDEVRAMDRSYVDRFP